VIDPQIRDNDTPTPPTPIKYQGRKAQRADSRERRRAILEATLRVIVKEGMRGVRHRAVAKEADVPLAATTYYFKDINDLINDAFNLYAEDSLAQVEPMVESSFAFLRDFPLDRLSSQEVMQQLLDGLSQFILNNILTRVADREMRILEHAFRNEALRNPQLAATARIPQEQMRQTVMKFFTLLGSTNAAADADVIMGTVLHLEYESLTSESKPDQARLKRTVKRLVQQTLCVNLRQ